MPPEIARKLGLTESVVPSLAGHSVALDNSALSNLLNTEDDLILRFVRATLRQRATIAFSKTVLFEVSVSSDANVPAVVRRLEALQRLQRGLGPLLCLCLGYNELIQAEARGWLRGPLADDVDWSWFAQADHHDLQKVAADPESYDFMTKKKKELFDLDRSLHRSLRERGLEYNPDQLFALIVAANPPHADEMVIEWAAKFSNGVWSPERIVADRMRFKATHVLAHLVWRLHLANSADRQTTTHQQEQIFGLWRTKGGERGKGTWYDTFIAGEAAYMDLLVSDDKNQRARCEFLSKMGLLSFKSISLDEFIV